MDNKVNWGLALSSWGKITVNSSGNDVYGAPIPFKTNRQISWTQAGDVVKVFANGTVIYVGRQNSGYTGSIELTSMDDEFAKWALGESTDSNNVQYEIKEPTVNRFYLMWEWIQDEKNTRHIMYNITATRPDLNSITKGDGDSLTAQYTTVNLTAIPRADGIVKAKTRVDVNASAYNGWFSAAYVPSGSGAQSVTVTVTASSQPVSGATVVLTNPSSSQIGSTGTNGQAVFSAAAGTYDIMVSDGSHTAKTTTATVSNAAVTKSISMT